MTLPLTIQPGLPSVPFPQALRSNRAVPVPRAKCLARAYKGGGFTAALGLTSSVKLGTFGRALTGGAGSGFATAVAPAVELAANPATALLASNTDSGISASGSGS